MEKGDSGDVQENGKGLLLRQRWVSLLERQLEENLTLDQLMKNGWSLVKRCCLCEGVWNLRPPFSLTINETFFCGIWASLFLECILYFPFS
ncbi:hypothetical protein AAG906_023834 [Vitis piasezkii]